MSYFLGVDAGSSKTHTLVVDEAGHCVGFGKGGGGNHQGVTHVEAKTAQTKGILQAERTNQRVICKSLFFHSKSRMTGDGIEAGYKVFFGSIVHFFTYYYCNIVISYFRLRSLRAYD